MTGKRARLLLILSHPVQYVSPLLRRMANHPEIEIFVGYASLRGAEVAHDPGFNREIAWDVPLLDGYPWCVLHESKNRATGNHQTFNYRPLRGLISSGSFNAAYVGGYNFPDAWLAFACLAVRRLPLLFSCEAHSLDSWRVQSPMRRAIKRFALQNFYRFPRRILAGSSATVKFLGSIGVPSQRILLAGNVVDNDWWTRQAAACNRISVRHELNIPADASVALFCAKLQPWKRPGDALEAFAEAKAPNSFLIFAGDGPLSASLKERAEKLGAADRVRWLGFVNQTELPGVYVASDVLLLPSSFEPFGLVVNEAMSCGRPAVVSDRVGAKQDLIVDGQTGYAYPCGDVQALARILREVFEDSEKLAKLGAAARARIESWSPQQNVDAYVRAVREVVAERNAAVGP